MNYRFGIFEFDSDSGELRRNGRAVALEPQPAKALALLLAKGAEVVSRDELRDAVWGRDTHVDFDRGLAYCLSQIRTALGDSGENPRFVQTIPKRGYRFIAPISPGMAPAVTSEPQGHVFRSPAVLLGLVVLAVIGGIWMMSGPRAADRTVIAVSVFDNETGVAEYDRPVATLSDLVVERLTKLDPARIAVIGNAAVLRQPRKSRNLKAVAASVKADYVLLGQLQRGESGSRSGGR